MYNRNVYPHYTRLPKSVNRLDRHETKMEYFYIAFYFHV